MSSTPDGSLRASLVFVARGVDCGSTAVMLHGLAQEMEHARWTLFRSPGAMRASFDAALAFVVRQQVIELYRPLIPMQRFVLDVWVAACGDTTMDLRARVWLAPGQTPLPAPSSSSSSSAAAASSVGQRLLAPSPVQRDKLALPVQHQSQPDWASVLTAAERASLSADDAASLYLHRTGRLVCECLVMATAIGADRRPAPIPFRVELRAAIVAAEAALARAHTSALTPASPAPTPICPRLFSSSPDAFPLASIARNADAAEARIGPSSGAVRVLCFTCTMSEVDLQQHMNQAQYIAWFQRGLYAYFAGARSFAPAPIATNAFSARRVGVRYIREVKCGDAIEIWAAPSPSASECVLLEMRRLGAAAVTTVVARAESWGGAPQQVSLPSAL